MRALLLLLVVVVSASAASTFSVMATTFDFEAKSPVLALGHFVIGAGAASPLVQDFPNYTEAFNVLYSSPLGAWQYVAVTADGNELYVRVFDLLRRNATRAVPVALSSMSELHCSSTTCYALDINSARVVTIDPYSGVARTLFSYSAATWIGVQEDASAFDAARCVLYATLLDADARPVLAAIDLRAHSIARVAGAFAVNNTGPLCFDGARVQSLGSPLGAIVAWSPASGAVTVLRPASAPIAAIAGQHAWTCAGSVAALAAVDFLAPASPMILLAFNYTQGWHAVHNSTCVAVHGLHMAAR